MNTQQTEFVRFTLGRRVEHLALALSFAVLVATGMPQKFHNATWAQWLITTMGGVEFVRVIHRFSAVLCGLTCLYHLADGLYRLFVKREEFSMLPRLKDVTDVLDTVKYFFGRTHTPPQFERFNFRQKFDYWAVFWGIAIIGGSGLVLWFPLLATRFLPGWVIPIAKTAHSDEALLALLAIAVWHLYNSHLNPGVFPIDTSIITGKISERRFREEHPLEYARLMQAAPGEAASAEAVVPWSDIVLSGLAALVILVILAVLLWAGLNTHGP